MICPICQNEMQPDIADADADGNIFCMHDNDNCLFFMINRNKYIMSDEKWNNTNYTKEVFERMCKLKAFW